MTFQGALTVALPEIFLAVSALVLLLLGAIAAPRSNGLVSGLSALALVIAAGLTAVGTPGYLFGGGYVADGVAVFAKVAIYLMSAVAVLLGYGWLERLKAGQFEYPVLILLAALGMGMMASSGDLISLYVGVELQSLALYVMAAFRRDDAKASEAGLKYFVLGALSSGLLLYGASLVYGFSGSVRFVDIAHAVQSGAGTGVLFGLVFLICGLAFKVSAAPFHMWTPDVYEGAPTPVVGFFAAAPKFAAMVLFARALADAFPGAVEQWRQVMIIIAVFSMLLGAFAGLVQRNLKRLWAYSSIANVGYALVGLSAGTHEGFQAMMVFMVLYMIDVTGFFA
ncbi:MAG: NADH-quinone oxidoreductase subunit N, partial [Caulobacteraceae bacterium]|nr:NADH-quinone oxidoreductase subunit N [Caulobacteraceae bacterium]